MKIILTGTRAYGPAREDSDYDFVMLYWDAEKLKEILREGNISYEENSRINPVYRGFVFEFGGKQIQIICADNEEDLAAWEIATERMKGRRAIKDREYRIEIFQKYYHEQKRS